MARCAALPLRVFRDDDEAAWLAEALPESLSDMLTGIDGLVVRPVETVRLCLREGRDLARIGEELGIDYALLGTLLSESTSSVRTTWRLTATKTGEQLWSQVYEFQSDRLHWLEEMVARRLLRALRLDPSEGESLRLSRSASHSLAAYVAYLKGNSASQSGDPDALRTAVKFYRKSIDLEPCYAVAWARMGLCLRRMELDGYEQGESTCTPNSAFRRALELSPDSPLVYKFMTELAPECGRARESLEILLQRLGRRPEDSESWARLVRSCRYCGLLRESLDADRMARSIDLKAPSDVARTHFLLSNWETVVRTTNAGSDHYLNAAAHAALGHSDRALELLVNRPAAESETPMDRLLLSSLAVYLHKGSRKAAALMRDPVPDQPRDPERLLYLARHFARFGEAGRALALCEQVTDLGLVHASTLEEDPWFENVRGLGSFDSLLQRNRDLEAENRSAFRAGLANKYFSKSA